MASICRHCHVVSGWLVYLIQVTMIVLFVMFILRGTDLWQITEVTWRMKKVYTTFKIFFKLEAWTIGKSIYIMQVIYIYVFTHILTNLMLNFIDHRWREHREGEGEPLYVWLSFIYWILDLYVLISKTGTINNTCSLLNRAHRRYRYQSCCNIVLELWHVASKGENNAFLAPPLLTNGQPALCVYS